MDKRSVVKEMVKLGMDFEEAALLAECSFDEIEELRNDDNFQRELVAYTAILERDLLKLLHTAAQVNAAEGNTTELRWLLERINPKRWSSSRNCTLRGKDNGPIAIVYDDGSD